MAGLPKSKGISTETESRKGHVSFSSESRWEPPSTSFSSVAEVAISNASGSPESEVGRGCGQLGSRRQARTFTRASTMMSASSADCHPVVCLFSSRSALNRAGGALVSRAKILWPFSTNYHSLPSARRQPSVSPCSIGWATLNLGPSNHLRAVDKHRSSFSRLVFSRRKPRPDARSSGPRLGPMPSRSRFRVPGSPTDGSGLPLWLWGASWFSCRPLSTLAH